MKDILQRLKELKTERLVSRIKHLRGRHDQRDHNRWPAGYQAQGYIPVGGGRRAGLLSSRATGGLVGITQTNIMMNQTKRLEPKVKIGTPDPLLAPMPIDVSEFLPGGKIYEAVTDVDSSEIARELYYEVLQDIVINANTKADFNSETIESTIQSEPLHKKVAPSELTQIANDVRRIRINYKNFKDAITNMNPSTWSVLKDEKTGLTVGNPHAPGSKDAKEYESRIELSLQILSSFYEKQIRDNKKYQEANEKYRKASEKMESYEKSPSAYMFSFPMGESEKRKFDFTQVKSLERDMASAMEYVFKLHHDSKLIKENPELSDYVYLGGGSISQRIDVAEKELSNQKDMWKKRMKSYIQGNEFAFSDKQIDDYINNRLELVESDVETNFYNRQMKDDSLTFYNISNTLKENIAELKAMEIASSNFQIYLNNNNVFEKLLFDNFAPKMLFDVYAKSHDISDLQKQKDEFVNKINEILNVLKGIDLSKLTDESTKSNITQYIENYSKISDYLDSLDLKKIDIENNKALDEVVENFSSPDSIRVQMMKMFFDKMNRPRTQKALGLIYEMQSYNGKPNVVEWDEIIDPSTDVVKDEKGNPLLFWRTLKGVNWDEPDGEDRGEEYVEQMRTGETHYPGTGVSGFGSYMKTSNYTGNNKDSRGVYRQQDISPELKNQIQSAINDFQSAINNTPLKGTAMLSDEDFKEVQKYFDDGNLDYMFIKIAGQMQDVIEKNASNNTTENNVLIKKAYNNLVTLGLALSFGKQYTRDEVLTAAAVATRAYYGEYTNGYTINSDARIPPTLVNGYNNGNDNHASIESLDNEVRSWFDERYKDISDMIQSNNANIGVILAILGWDAYPAHVNEYSTNYVILNRAILNMSNRTMGPDYTEDDIRQSIENRKLVK